MAERADEPQIAPRGSFRHPQLLRDEVDLGEHRPGFVADTADVDRRPGSVPPPRSSTPPPAESLSARLGRRER